MTDGVQSERAEVTPQAPVRRQAKRTRRQSALTVLSILVRVGILLALLIVMLQDAAAYREHTRGAESGLADDQPIVEVPRAGVGVALEQYGTNLALLEALSVARDLGYGTLVQHFDWATMEPSEGAYDWGTWDYTLSLVQEQGFQVIAVLDGAPAWARAEYEADNPLAPPQDPVLYARFAGAFAARFGDRIRAYQIWDQPNIYPNWGKGAIDPAGYVALLKAASTAIREVDRDAVIVAGGLAPNTEASGRNMSDVQYLREIYRLKGGQWFDVLGVKAYGFWTGAYDRRVDREALNFSRVILLREEMVKRGDAAKPVWALEGGWAALDADWQGAASTLGTDTAGTQASRLTDAFERVQREWPWMTLFCALNLQPAADDNDPVWGLSLLNRAGQPRPLMLELGTGLRTGDTYVPGKHRVTSSLLPEGLPPDQERAVIITFRGTDLAVDLDPEGAQGEMRVLAPFKRTVKLDDSATSNQRAWLIRGQHEGEHTLQLVGTARQLRAIRSVQVVNRPDSASMWLKRLAALALSLWLILGIWLQLRTFDWRLPYRWANGLVGRVPDPWVVAGLALLFLLAMVAPGSMIRLCLLALYGLGVLFRPDVALLVAVATIPVAPVRVGLGPGNFSITELAVLCAVLARAGAILFGGLRPVTLHNRSTLRVDLLLLAFVVWTGIGAWNAEYQREALREFRTAVTEPALLYLLLRLTGDDRRLWQSLVRVFFASAVGTALYALLRYPSPQGAIEAEGVRRAQGFFGSPNNLALLAERFLPLGVSVAIEEGPRRRRWGYALGALILLAAIILTYSRGAWLLGVPAGLLALGLLKGRRTRRYVLAGLALLAVGMIPLLQTERFGSLLDFQGGTSFLRIRLWQASWEMIQDHPWTGVGLDNFLYYYGDYILPGAEIERWLSHPHNIVLDLWVRTGLPGLLLFMGALASAAGAVLKCWKARTAEQRMVLAGLLGGLAAMLAHGLIDNAVFVPELAYWTMFVFSYLANAAGAPVAAGGQPATALREVGEDAEQVT